MALIRCNCDKPAAAYQDAVYGKGVRVGCPKVTKSGPPIFTCTVCGSQTDKEVKN